MDITVEGLLAKAEEAPVLFTLFVDKISHYGENFLYCFVEDYDMPYYSGIISALFTNEWTSIRCKGKEQVLKIFNYIKDIEQYSHYKKRFFIDRDFDDNSSLDKDIYVTPSYAIENFYAMDDCMRKILETEYEIDPISDEELFNKTITHYQTRREEFHQATLLFNAWYACLHEDPSWSHDNVSLNHIFPKSLLNYSIDTPIVASYTILDIEAMYPGVPHIANDVINIKKASLSTDLTLNLRGKYEIEFVYKYILFLNKDAGTRSRQYTKKNKNYNFTLDGAVTSMSQYAHVPENLRHYIINGTMP